MSQGNGQGGRRPGAGRPRGSRNKSTLAKIAAGDLKLPQLSRGELVALSRSKAPEMLSALVVIAENPKAPAAARVNAASTVLAYGYGRPAAMAEGKAPKDGGDVRKPLRMVQPGDSDFVPVSVSGEAA